MEAKDIKIGDKVLAELYVTGIRFARNSEEEVEVVLSAKKSDDTIFSAHCGLNVVKQVIT